MSWNFCSLKGKKETVKGLAGLGDLCKLWEVEMRKWDLIGEFKIFWGKNQDGKITVEECLEKQKKNEDFD